MAQRINIDIAGDCPLVDFLMGLEENHAKLIAFMANGPGGGNPNVTLEFLSRDDAIAYLQAMDYDLADGDLDQYFV